jgi:nitrate/nitrite transporter NarK
MVKTAFFPVFFGRVFPEYKPEFAFLNAICVSGVGLISCLFGGALADKYEKNSYLTKAWICIIGCAASVPFVALGSLDTDSFYLSFICYIL